MEDFFLGPSRTDKTIILTGMSKASPRVTKNGKKRLIVVGIIASDLQKTSHSFRKFYKAFKRILCEKAKRGEFSSKDRLIIYPGSEDTNAHLSEDALSNRSAQLSKMLSE